jgi:hypothetical protein
MWAAISASSLPSSQRRNFNDASRVRSPPRTSQRIGRVFSRPAVKDIAREQLWSVACNRQSRRRAACVLLTRKRP